MQSKHALYYLSSPSRQNFLFMVLQSQKSELKVLARLSSDQLTSFLLHSIFLSAHMAPLPLSASESQCPLTVKETLIHQSSPEWPLKIQFSLFNLTSKNGHNLKEQVKDIHQIKNGLRKHISVFNTNNQTTNNMRIKLS